MISKDFAYYCPERLEELPRAIEAADQPFLFYGGGSEILSMARAGSIAPAAVIDVKSIPEMREIKRENGVLTLGAAVTLAEIAENNAFPLLSATVSRIADHTNQCRITLGGNIAGTIIYREAALPLLLADAQISLISVRGVRTSPLLDLFQKRLQRAPDEAALGFHVKEKYLHMPWVHAKRTRGEKIDYPVVTIAAMRAQDGLRFALSGVLAYPFRDAALEKIFSDSGRSAAQRAMEIVENLPEAPISDNLAGADWRAFQARRALEEAIKRLEGVSI